MGALVEINTDGLAKFADTISFALGGTARGEKKMADAKAYAAEVEARTKYKVALIEAQGQETLANYVMAKESRKLSNTMAVIEKAQSHFTEGEQVSDEPIDEGWENRFFNIVEEISDDELREIWGRVLAGEIKKPKSYSLRTLECLRNLNKEEASLIVKVAPYYVNNDFIYKNCPISLVENYVLQECGILLDDGNSIQFGFRVDAHTNHALVLDCENALVMQNDSDNIIKCDLRIFKLSTAGKEIMNLITIDKDIRDFFIKSLVNDLYAQGFSKIYKQKIIKNNGDSIETGGDKEEYN